MEHVVSSIKKHKEIFSTKLFLILAGIHAIAIYGIIYHFTLHSFITYLFCHLYFISVGTSMGLHRYFSHRSFSVNSKALDFIIHLTSTLCLQGGPIYWATTHRAHHKYSEKYGDPHSATRGFLWSHVGWLLYQNPNGFSYLQSIKYCRDLRKQGMTAAFEKHHLSVNILFLAALFIFSYSINDLSIFFWLGPIRIVSVWHATWLVNSYAHSAPLLSGKPKIINSFILCILAGGDGEHAYHHNRQFTVKHSARNIHADYSYLILRALKSIGLVSFKAPTSVIKMEDRAAS